jgi:Na+-driven multidrug efflux pump
MEKPAPDETKRYWHVVFPAFGQSVASMLPLLVDIYFMARFTAADGVAAIASMLPFFFLSAVVSSAYTRAGSVIALQQGSSHGLSTNIGAINLMVLANGILFGFAVSAVILIWLLAFPHIVSWTVDQSRLFTIYGYSVLLALALGPLRSAIATVFTTRVRPDLILRCNVLYCVSNVLLNLVACATLVRTSNDAAAVVGASTSVAAVVTTFYGLWVVRKHRNLFPIDFSLRNLASVGPWKQFLHVAVPSALEPTSFGLASLITATVFGAISAPSLAARAFVRNLTVVADHFSFAHGYWIEVAAAASYGAGNLSKESLTMVRRTLLAGIICLMLFAVAAAFSWFLYATAVAADVREAIILVLIFEVPAQILTILNISLINFLISTNSPGFPAKSAVFVTWLFTVPMLIIFVFVLNYGLIVALCISLFDSILRTAINSGYFFYVKRPALSGRRHFKLEGEIH